MAAIDPEIASALVEAVRHDPSVNVRLAAIDTLSKTAGRPDIAGSLTRALPDEESPMVQAAPVDYLVDADDRQAIGAIEALAARPGLNPAVRERTRFAVENLKSSAVRQKAVGQKQERNGMHRLSILAAVTLGIVALAADHANYSTEARETFSRALSAAKTLEVDNFNGSIEVSGEVSGGGGSNVRVTGEQIIHALDQTELDRAKREVTLDVNEKDGVPQFYVNGPFRQHAQPGDYYGFHERSDHEYEVTYNFTIHVPRQMAIALRTVNGAIRTNDRSGHFDPHSVNGGVFTDFEATALAPTMKPEPRDGRFVYRADRGGTVRVGAGGPEIDIETVNGAIEIHKQAN
jgi:hypothetical protein